ncbi:MAG: DUF4912 domain-containing protein [Bacillota bacterium]
MNFVNEELYDLQDVKQSASQTSSDNHSHNLESKDSTDLDLGAEYELPDKYQLNRMVLQVKNPETIHLYWECTIDKLVEIAQQAGYDNFEEAPLVLRLYDWKVEDSEPDYYDVDIMLEHDDWYFNDLEADHTYLVKLGIMSDKFYTLLESNKVVTPRNQVSDVLDEEWMIVNDKLEKIYDLAGVDEVSNGGSLNNYSSLESLKN